MEHAPVVLRGLSDVRCCDGDAVTLEAQIEAPSHSSVRWEKAGRVSVTLEAQIEAPSHSSVRWDKAGRVSVTLRGR